MSLATYFKFINLSIFQLEINEVLFVWHNANTIQLLIVVLPFPEITWLHRRGRLGWPCARAPTRSWSWRKWELLAGASCPPRSRGRSGPRSGAGSTRRGFWTPGWLPCPEAGIPCLLSPILLPRAVGWCCAGSIRKGKIKKNLERFFYFLSFTSTIAWLFVSPPHSL